MPSEPLANEQMEQHSLLKSVILHLVPGLFILLIVLIASPIVINLNWPEDVVIIAGIGFVLIPLELGYLLYRAKHKSGRLSLKSVVLYRNSISVWKYILWTVPIMDWILFVFGVISPPIDKYLIENVFWWLPDSLIGDAETGPHSQSTLLTIWFLVFLCNGIFGPLVEEFYFRGYLLPRISRYGNWAPVINAVLFSLYHFFSPWQNPARIIALLPMVYAVYRSKNIYIGIIIHCGINTLGMLLALLELLGSK